MQYRLIAIDLDGTVVNQEGTIIQSAKKAVQYAISRGIKVTLATGRMYQPSNRFAQELGLSIPLICYQGALIREPFNRNVIRHKPLPVPIALKVIETARQIDIHQYVYVDNEMYVEEIMEKDEWYAQRNGVELNLVEDLLTFLTKQPTEIAARGETSDIDRLIVQLNHNFGSALQVNKVNSSFCEIGHHESGKGNALKYLAKSLGIKRSQTVAIGDGPNDVSMLKWAGLGIAVDNAPEEVKNAADWVVVNKDDDGFAQAIEKLLDM